MRRSIDSRFNRRRLSGLEQLESRCLLAVVINEFHYDPVDSTTLTEFIELHNDGPAAVDLGGWTIDDAVDYEFPSGASIAASGYVVIAQHAPHFQAEFGFSPFGEWETGDKLSNSGETIELRDAANQLVDSVEYELGFPWPTSGETGGSVELINPAFDNDDGGNWRSSGYSSQTAPQTFIAPGSTWDYRKGVTQNPPADWTLASFNTASDPVSWQSGVTPIGYGDGDDATVLSDMRFNYSTVYLRKSFTIAGAIPDELTLGLYVDDSAIVWINGVEVHRAHLSGGPKDYDDGSGHSHEAEWEEIALSGASAYLVAGTNTVAVHALNYSENSSDFSIDLQLRVPQEEGGPPTPGAQNSVFAANAAPYLRKLDQSIQQPLPGQDVVISIKATDPEGVQSVSLAYQLVNPGDYIAIDDPRYHTEWTSLPMVDDGTGGDLVVGDDVYTATIPGSLQTHRRLVRYRITAADGLNASVTAPYADDTQPNFAYFVYGETPTWTGAVQPGVTRDVDYDAATLNSVAAYHLITTRQDHVDAQYLHGTTLGGGYGGSDYLWNGALVYDGVVYDHIRFRARGGVWRYAMGKNMWKFDFNRGHSFQARDDYGNPFDVAWDKLNLSALIQQRDYWHRGEQGLFEALGFKLFNLAGVAAPNTNYVQFRIIENADENGADQYSSDFQGLYMALEQLDGRFLDEHGLPDGNLYKMEAGTGVGGIGCELNNQGDYPEVSDSSDLIAFKTAYEGGTQSAQWWDDNLNLEQYYSYRSIVEAIHHYDIGAGKNYFYYHNPDSGKWEVVPWDLDLTWADNMYGNGNEPFRSRVLAYAEYMLDYRNRQREIRDLLYNVEQVGWMAEELGALVNTAGESSLVDADRALWDYNPILASGNVDPNKAGQGQYYAGGGGVAPTGNFAGMMQLVEDYAATRGAWIDANILTPGEEALIPDQPVVAYTGPAGFPSSDLTFSTSAFSDPNGSNFANMQWRIAEISNPAVAGFDPNAPWKYEIDATWESGEVSSFDSTVQIPAGAVEEGRTYRVRVRMQDDTGRWSHWSDPQQFTAAAAINLPDVRIVEINYNPADNAAIADEQDLEFLELQNVGSQVVDLSGMQVADFASNPYVIDNGTSLAPGERLVIARNPAVLQQAYGPISNLAPSGYATANLSNGGETVRLLTAAGAEIQNVTYSDDPPWPGAEVDGGGSTLVIVDPLGDGSDAANWQVSSALGGTPGTADVPYFAGDFDQNGQVDGGDFLLWQRNVAVGELSDWQSTFGSQGSPASPAVQAVAASSVQAQRTEDAFLLEPSATAVVASRQPNAADHRRNAQAVALSRQQATARRAAFDQWTRQAREQVDDARRPATRQAVESAASEIDALDRALSLHVAWNRL